VPVPPLTADGFLPFVVHECTVREIGEAFGGFQASDRRIHLFQKLSAFLDEARASGLVESVIVDGSFVTAKAQPADIDLVLELEAEHDFSFDLPPASYNVLSRKRVQPPVWV